MNCKDFQKQFEVGFNLNDIAKTHLSGCENCQAFERKEINLTQMINSLPKVEAPKDFGFRLNSYIKKIEKTKRPLPAVWQTLRFGLPLAAAVLIFGFVIFNSNLFNSQNQNLQATKEEKKSEIKESFEKNLPKENTELQNSIVAENGEKILEDKAVQPIIDTEKPDNKSTNKQTVKIKRIEKLNKSVKKTDKPADDFVGSGNFASTQPPVLLPQNNSVNDEQTETKFVGKRNTLLEIGISMEAENWKVNVIKKESVAEKSGVQIGDVILKINEIPVSAKIPQNENIKTKSLKVLRGNNIVNINLVNNE
ncbi:MAG: hypothetical protein ACR2J3_06325 [Aridibacter sp.]